MRARIQFLFFLFFPVWLLGQYSGGIHYTVKDGLPSSTTYSVVQDNQGFVWIGTEAGLVRYDGSKFKIFTISDGLPDNEVLGLMFDEVTNRLWVVTYSKSVCYYSKGIFYTGRNDSSLRDVTCDFGEFIGGNSQPGLGVFLFNGFSTYKFANGKISKSRNAQLEGVLQMNEFKDSSQDIIFRRGVEIYYKDSLVRCIGGGLDSINESGKWISDILFLFRHHAVDLYRRTDNGYTLKGRIEKNTEQPLTCIVLSRAKYYFSAAGDGVYEVDTSLSAIPRKIWSGSVNGIFSDKNENLWITTSDDGLYVLKNTNAVNYSTANGLDHDNITTLFVDSDGLYWGNSYGDIYNLKNNVLHRVNINIGKERIRGINKYGKYVFLINNVAVAAFDTLQRKIDMVPHVAGGPKSMLKLKNNTKILVGLLSTIIELDLIKKTSREIPFYKRIIDIKEHPDGRIFCGSLDGIYQFVHDSLIRVENKDGRLQSRVTSMCFSRDSILWIGTPSDGIIAFDGHKIIGQINATKYMGYHGAICRKVIPGGENEIWTGTNAGINRIRYHLQDSVIIDNITPINTLDGLLSDDVNDVLLRDSLVYIATSHGLTILNINQISKTPEAPIYISSVRINDKDSLIHQSIYDLKFWQNNLRIEYVGILLPSAGDMRYKYRLLGSGNDKWETTNNTSLEFRSLSPGAYTFEVAVLDKFGNRSMHSAFVKFNIRPAYYQTFWFWGVVIMIILFSGFYLIRSRFRRQQAINTKIIDLEQQALKAQMNPHFIFNCLTAIQHFVNKEDVYSANMYLSNFAKLIRKTLDLSGEQYITLDKEVSYLENYIQLERLRFQDQFKYVITVAENVDVFAVQVPPMLLQPIIENAIRHGLRYKDNDEGMLNIGFVMEYSTLICTIDDNGIGIKRSTELKSNTHIEYQSKGMKLTESRISAINMISEKKIYMEIKSKYDTSGSALGTTIIVRFMQ